jgi:hypothetical protein
MPRVVASLLASICLCDAVVNAAVDAVTAVRGAVAGFVLCLALQRHIAAT